MAATLTFALTLAAVLAAAFAADDCSFCLPACNQKPFPGDLCDRSTIASVRAIVLSNHTTVCTRPCDGKGIASGSLKTIYVLSVIETFKGAVSIRPARAMGTTVFSTNPLRRGVNMDVGKEYFINLEAPLPGTSGNIPYIDRCDHPDLWTSLSPKQHHFLRSSSC